MARDDYIPTKLTEATLWRLLGVRGELAPLLYLVLSHLGAHRAEGWPGTVRDIKSVLLAHGRSTNNKRICDGLRALECAGLLERREARNRPTVFRLVPVGTEVDPSVGTEVDPPMGTDADPSVGTVFARGGYCSGTTVGTDPEPPFTIRRREEKGGEESRDARGGLPVYASPIPIRSSEPVYGAADGLADEFVAVGLNASETEIEEAVRCSDAAEVRRQLRAWPDRKTEWADDPVALFLSYCRNRKAPPAGRELRPRPLSPDDRSAFLARLQALEVSELSLGDALFRRGARSVDALTAAQATSIVRYFEHIYQVKHGGEPPAAEARS